MSGITIKYSPSTKGFYTSEVDYTNSRFQLPSDLIDVSDEEYHAALNKDVLDTLSIQNGRLVVVRPTPLTDVQKLILAKKEAMESVKARHAEILSELTDNQTNQEMLTWGEKAAAAKESIAAGAPTPDAIKLFQGEATARGVSVLERCRRSIEKREMSLKLVGIAGGFKDSVELNILNATSLTSLAEVLATAERDLVAKINEFKELEQRAYQAAQTRRTNSN